MHPDGPEHRVVDHDDDDRYLILHRGRQLVAAHQKVAVAGPRDDRPLGVTQFGRDRGRHAVPHRAGGRSYLRVASLEFKETLQPPGEIPRAVADDRIVRERSREVPHDRRKVQHPARQAWCQLRAITVMRRLRPGPPARSVDRRERRMIELILRPHGVEHHVAVRQQRLPFVSGDADRVGKHGQRICLRQVANCIEVAAFQQEDPLARRGQGVR